MGVIVFEINELVLNGFPRVDRDRVSEAFQRELTRLLHVAPPNLESGRTVDVVSLPALPPATSSRRLGEMLARAVHDGVTRA
ncbi:hypothetical protein [Kibdelosporangium aridum]|uniref:Uncharacterized protein n=1 Tax=Kibdelosporangium aridum TaxID=2030 RepID=A0A1W1ZHW1_KIBAR|nr:hypothetical protein [Kibdelosporangium aridum]SMC47628.1 hypothetical protein SAMN05661093_00051 [Kibdelosporangium aridum]